MSKVFEARKRAEQSKRAREVVGAMSQSPDSERPADEHAVATGSLADKPYLRPAASAELYASSAQSSTTSGLSLGLTGERRANDWRVRWNRAAVVNAVRGCLSITDGSIRKQADLDPVELQSGSIVYTPITDDVFLRLEIAGPDLAILVSESVRLIGGARPFLPFKSSTEQPGTARIARSDAVWAASTKAAKDADTQHGPIVRSLLRTPRFEPPLSAPQNEPSFAQVVGNIEPAVLISRRNPVYPAIAEQQFISGRVEVHFCISPEGRVYDVKSVQGSPILARAAIEAVEAWRYKPARLNGTPVDSQARTNFDFKLN